MAILGVDGSCQGWLMVSGHLALNEHLSNDLMRAIIMITAPCTVNQDCQDCSCVCLDVVSSVCVCHSVLIMTMSRAKMTKPIQMPFRSRLECAQGTMY